MAERHDRGGWGETEMGFFLGERGYFFVDGPGSHDPSARGFDGLAFNPKTRHLVIYDNKAWRSVGPVSGASSIDVRRNFNYNLDKMISWVGDMQDMPSKIEILNSLRQTRNTTRLGTPWPSNVDVAISNAIGRSTGVGGVLANQGIKFIDYNQAPRPQKIAIGNQELIGFIGAALGVFFQWLGDIGIQREINRRLNNDMAPQVADILRQGNGVLLVICLQEDEIADDNNMRTRSLLAIYVYGGRTQQSTQIAWESQPRISQGPAKGFRTITRYGWIPPLQ